MRRHLDFRGSRRGAVIGRGRMPLAGLLAGIVLAQSLALAQPGGVAAAGTHPITLQVRIHDAAHGLVTSVAAGSPVHLRVTVFADIKDDPIPTGQASVIYYTDGSCTTAGGSRSGALVGGTADPAGDPVIPARAGSMSFRASYGGDPTFVAGTSACLPLTVTRATPSLALRLEYNDVEASTIDAGQVIVMRLTVAGPAGVVPATGGVVIQFHTGTTCSSLSGTTLSLLSEGAYLGHRRMQLAGEYSVNATYDGDANWFSGAFTGCLPLTVTKAPSTLTTTVHDAAHVAVTTVPAGTVVHPGVVIGTGVRLAPTGTLRARTYSDAACTTPSGSAVDVPVVRDGYDGMADITTLSTTATPGTHAFRVDYLGDGSFLPVQGACTPYSVTGAPPTNAPPTNAPPTNAVPTYAPSAAGSPVPTTGATTPTTAPPGAVASPSASVAGVPGTSTPPEPGASLAESQPPAPGGSTALPTATGSSSDLGILAVLALAILAGGLAFAGATYARRHGSKALPR